VEKGEVAVKFGDVDSIGTPRCSRNGRGFENGIHNILGEYGTWIEARNVSAKKWKLKQT
jgi:hypothetical protein